VIRPWWPWALLPTNRSHRLLRLCHQPLMKAALGAGAPPVAYLGDPLLTCRRVLNAASNSPTSAGLEPGAVVHRICRLRFWRSSAAPYEDSLRVAGAIGSPFHLRTYSPPACSVCWPQAPDSALHRRHRLERGGAEHPPGAARCQRPQSFLSIADSPMLSSGDRCLVGLPGWKPITDIQTWPNR